MLWVEGYDGVGVRYIRQRPLGCKISSIPWAVHNEAGENPEYNGRKMNALQTLLKTDPGQGVALAVKSIRNGEPLRFVFW